MSQTKILVIDDSIVIRKRIKEMLTGKKAVIVEATDGNEGLKLLAEQRPNYIILDFIMPNTTGWEVYQKIQSQKEYRIIPLVLMSGRKEEVTDKISEPFELFSFLEKPFNQQELYKSIQEAQTKAKKRKTNQANNKQEIKSTNQIAQLEKTVTLLAQRVSDLEQEIEALKAKEKTS